MEITGAVEGYLKVIYNLQHRPGSDAGPVATSAVAARLGVARPSVSAMLARLEHDGLVRRHQPRGVTLTHAGTEAALRVVRRHRLLETLLFDRLGVPWDEVHEEAERLEHMVSERLEGYIDRSLGYPTHDPHGDPIPRPDEPVETLAALAAAPDGCRFSIRRVSDADPAVLRFLGEQGIRPGTTVTVVEHSPFDGPVWVTLADRDARLPLPPALARAVYGVPVQSN